jgi:hypothetical protein
MILQLHQKGLFMFLYLDGDHSQKYYSLEDIHKVAKRISRCMTYRSHSSFYFVYFVIMIFLLYFPLLNPFFAFLALD